MNQGVVLFHTTSAALRAEKVLTKAGLKVKLVPTPRELSSDCGISLRFEWADRAQVEAGLAQAGLEGDIHSL
jgi:hypothetical protein